MLALGRRSPLGLVRPIAWGVLQALASAVRDASGRWGVGAAWGAGVAAAFGGNLVNNLPAGLLAGAAVGAADVPERVAAAVLIGIDRGPNLSVTGSLATILWLAALRREGMVVGAWAFLRVGAVVMPVGLALAFWRGHWAGDQTPIAASRSCRSSR